MIGRILWLAATIIVAIVLLYISRFWPFDLWSWKGLFGIKSLPPGGNLVARWLRGTPLSQLDLLIWISAVFMVLTWLEKLYHRLTPDK